MNLEDVLKKCNKLIDQAIVMRDEVAKRCIPNSMAEQIMELASDINDDLWDLDYADALDFIEKTGSQKSIASQLPKENQ